MICVLRTSRVPRAVAPGSHLLTTAQVSKSARGLYGFMFYLWGSTNFIALGASWPGDTNSSNVGWGQWRWVDNTDPSNLNCNSTGCNLWSR